jgi:hypothetical protein
MPNKHRSLSAEQAHYIGSTSPTDADVRVGVVWVDPDDGSMWVCTSVGPIVWTEVGSGASVDPLVLTEISEPSTPSANTLALYAADATGVTVLRFKLADDTVDTLVGKATTDTFTNKTFDADGTGNSITNIENADIKAAAGIAVNKLAALTVSELVGSDGSGFLTSLSVATYPSLTELSYVKGVTSSIQAQIDAIGGGSGVDGFTQASSGDGNTAIGNTALDSLTASSGLRNTAVGADAGTAVTTGDDNTLLGFQAGDSITGGKQNVAIGALAGQAITGSDNVTAIGYRALTANTGAANTAVGADALYTNTSGVRHVAIGYGALTSIQTASDSTAVGYQALRLDTGGSNTAVGSGALDANTSGTNNVGIGLNALGLASTSTDNIAIGNRAGDAITVSGHQNVLIGTDAGGAITTGDGNVFIGYQAGDAVSSGENNVAIGLTALSNATTLSDGNVAIGEQALNGVTTAGDGNIGIGHRAGATTPTTGDKNLLIGQIVEVPAGDANNQMNIGGLLWSDGYNTASGSLVSTGGLGLGGMPTAGTQFSIISGATTRTAVTAVGLALDIIADINAHANGAVTVAVGATAALGIITHTNNADSLTFTDAATLYIAGAPVASTNVVITNTALSLWVAGGYSLFSAGIMIGANADDNLIDDASNGTGSAVLYVGDEAISAGTSDIRAKRNIVSPNGLAHEHLLTIASLLHEYEYLSYPGQFTGVLAQELDTVLPQYVRKPANDSLWSVRYDYMVPALVSGWADQEQRLAVLEAENIALKSRILN